MKYVIGYSGGKDCTYTIEKLKEQGHELVGIYAIMTNGGIAVNHAITLDIYKEYADALGVSLYVIKGKSDFDQEVIYKNMLLMKKDGVEAVAYGETHLLYNEMCSLTKKAGLNLLAPLIHLDEDKLMDELLSRNYKMFVVNASKKIPCAKDIIGKYIDKEMIDALNKQRIVSTGNDGCYHSQVVDCPLFKHPIHFGKSRIVELEKMYLVVFDQE